VISWDDRYLCFQQKAVVEQLIISCKSVNRSQMEVISFLCVSLGSSTVQLHESQGSRHACACSGTGLSSQNGDRVFVEKKVQCK
jgi:hypothetical protein